MTDARNRSGIMVVIVGVAALLTGCGGSELVRGHYTVGVEHYDAGRVESAVESYRLALIDRPEDYRVHYNLGLAYHDLFREAGDPEVKKRHHDEAMASYDHVLELDEGNPRAMVSRARLMSDGGDPVGAFEYISAAIPNDDAGTALLHWSVGTMCVERKEPVEAEKRFRAALEHEPAYAPSVTALSELLVEGGRTEEAAAIIDAGVKAMTFDLTLRLLAGEIALLKDDAAAAKTHFRAALGLVPDNLRAHYGLARTYEAQGEVGRAVEHYWVARRMLASNERMATKQLVPMKVTPTVFRRDVSKRLTALYPMLGKWEQGQ